MEDCLGCLQPVYPEQMLNLGDLFIAASCSVNIYLALAIKVVKSFLTLQLCFNLTLISFFPHLLPVQTLFIQNLLALFLPSRYIP